MKYYHTSKYANQIKEQRKKKRNEHLIKKNYIKLNNYSGILEKRNIDYIRPVIK